MGGTKAAASRDHHPAKHIRKRGSKADTKPRSTRSLVLPKDENGVELTIGGRRLKLTNLRKLFWSSPKISKRDLLQYYIDISPYLLPHLQDRAMVMKRYPNGADGEFFFMKHAPESRPDWIEICSIEHESGNIINFVVVQDLPSLLWTVNLGCIDLNQWYARCDDVDRPDYLHFDLDPVPGASFARVRDAALLVRAALDALKMPSYAKTTGSKGIHIYVPIVRGPNQKEVWRFAKELAHTLEAHDPKLITAEYSIAKRPRGRILVDYNQNAWGRTLASVYSVRPKPRATVSAPVSWQEIEKGIKIEDFRLDNVPQRVRKLGDLWKPLLQKKARFKLDAYL
jgi:bifunctional non-homologous end joining protein LigD